MLVDSDTSHVEPARHPSHVDLVVVGGGINGLGAAWEAACRGLRTLVVEQGDVGSGTSSWSSRMIHGGIKYLEKYDVPLVRESLREREWLLQAAPHLVRPLPFVMPFFKDGKYNPWLLRAGLLAYDTLAGKSSLPRHTILSSAQIRAEFPLIDLSRLAGAGKFYDAQAAHAERLCVELAVAIRQLGGTVLTYTQADDILLRGSEVSGLRCTDTITKRSYEVSTSLILNAGGPWADSVLEGCGVKTDRLIGGTKGSHIVVKRFPGSPQSALYYESHRDGRPMLVIPWLGHYLIGSTDIRYSGDPGRATLDDEEMAYLLDETNRVFPSADLTVDDVVWSYTGVRPLPYQPDGSVADISRRHEVVNHSRVAQGLYSVVGGKLTTFRQLGEDAVDTLLGTKLGRQSPTRRQKLPGGRIRDVETLKIELADAFGSHDAAERLYSLYGARASLVREMALEDPRMMEPLDAAGLLTRAEVAYTIRDEQARTLTDILARRTMWNFAEDLGTSMADAVADAAAEILGWDESEVESQKLAHAEWSASHGLRG